MEGENEGGCDNYLRTVLTDQELSNLPQFIKSKINTYIEKVKLESKNSIGDEIRKRGAQEATPNEDIKNEEASKLLLASNETVIELEKQISILNAEYEQANIKISSLESEVVSLKSAKDRVIDEKNDLTRILERRDTELEGLRSVESTLSQQLKAAIDEKCEALALYDEIQSKNTYFQDREKQIEQERKLLNSKITGLSDENNRLRKELQTLTLQKSSKLLSQEKIISETNELLKVTKDTIAELSEERKNLIATVNSLTQRLTEQQEINRQMTDNYMKELDAKTKLADVFKSMNDSSEAKVLQLTNSLVVLEKHLSEANEKSLVLHNKFEQTEVEKEELIKKYDEKIASLYQELDKANDSLKAAKEHNINMTLNELAPSAAAAITLIKPRMSLTEIYSQLVKTTEELTQLKKENTDSHKTNTRIFTELEKKESLIHTLKVKYENELKSNAILTQQVNTLSMERDKLRVDLSESVRLNNNYINENNKLKEELGVLGRQVCNLLAEIAKSKNNFIPPGDEDNFQSGSNANTSIDLSSDILKKPIVTFSDIQELQENNQKLLRLVSDLRLSNEVKFKAQTEGNVQENKIKELESRLEELRQVQASQTTMMNSVIRQRDNLKKKYDDLIKSNESQPLQLTDNSDKSAITLPTTEPSILEIQLKEKEEQLEQIKDAYDLYREEKGENEKILIEQIDGMRKEITKLTAANVKLTCTSNFHNERLQALQTNILTYSKQITALENERKTYNITIATQEEALQRLRDEVLTAQAYIASADTKIEHLTMANKLLKQTEVRLHSEIEVLNRERVGQAQLVKNLELIKASSNRVEVEGRNKMDSNFDKIVKECSALKKRLQEEQDRYREHTNYLQRQTGIANLRIQEEKTTAASLRKEIAQLRLDLAKKTKATETLTKKFKDRFASSRDFPLANDKRINELETNILDKHEQIKTLDKQLSDAKEKIEIHSKKAEEVEKELNIIKCQYNEYKAETETKLSNYLKKIQHLDSEDNGGTLKTSFNKLENELQKALSENKIYETELKITRERLSRTSDLLQKAEEKYSQEIILHSTDIQALMHAKVQLTRTEKQISELMGLNNCDVNRLETEKLASVKREEVLNKQIDELTRRNEDLCRHNFLLHNQIKEIGTQLNINRSRSSLSDNVPQNVDEQKSCEQFVQIVEFLKKEKDIVLAKNNILQAETTRLKSQLEIAGKELDNTKLALVEEREKSGVSIEAINKKSDVLIKLQTLNALTDSNRALRTERDRLLAQVCELTASIKSLEEQSTCFQEKISNLTSKCEALKSENDVLKDDTAEWRTRVNVLLERTNKTNLEDWKRLQNERETLAKMLTSEKENIKKVTEEMATFKIDKSKLEEQYSLLSMKNQTIIEENNRLNKESQSLKNDIERLNENISQLKADLSEACTSNAKITKYITGLEETIVGLRNKEAQIKKIAKKYKTQYEETMKQMNEDGKQDEEGSDVASLEQNTSNEQENILADIKSEFDQDQNQAMQLQVKTHQQDATAAEKVTTEAPTADIKATPGVAQSSLSGVKQPLASIRPLVQVGSTGPAVAAHDAHTTEYMLASSSRPIPRNTDIASTASTEFTQVERVLASRTEKDGNAVKTATSAFPESARSVKPGSDADKTSGGAGAAVVSTALVARSGKHRLTSPPAIVASSKKSRLQGSVEVEYQVPTSSRCDQEDKVVKVLESKADDRCTGTKKYPAQSQEGGVVAAEGGHGSCAEPDSEPEPGTKRLWSSVDNNGKGGDSNVPSTPALCTRQPSDEDVVMLSEDKGKAEAAAIAAPTPPQATPSTSTGTRSDQKKHSAEQRTAAGSRLPADKVVGEEAREAEARARPIYKRGRFDPYFPPPPSHGRWLWDAETERGRGRGMRRRHPRRRGRFY